MTAECETGLQQICCKRTCMATLQEQAGCCPWPKLGLMEAGDQGGITPLALGHASAGGSLKAPALKRCALPDFALRGNIATDPCRQACASLLDIRLLTLARIHECKTTANGPNQDRAAQLTRPLIMCRQREGLHWVVAEDPGS